MSFTKEQLKLRKCIKDAIYENMAETVYRNAMNLVDILKNSRADLVTLAEAFELDPFEIDVLPEVDNILDHTALEDLSKNIADMIFNSLEWEFDLQSYQWNPPGHETSEGRRPRAVNLINSMNPENIMYSYRTLKE